ncbi:peptidase m16 : Putative Zn-dependent peptidase OS=Singulisphaera acidiphila (strain ATCC BAA-1392 / DSM 18658 / VKM B-2454 / MOB10) GN=Sinac_0823 PE=3 SV=1: Peptidase_M16: Peptidase_M16_C [Gemmata massiliana]|uniref:Peptidase M16 C-terminal domain-containing protein n=1 Tax=Gemmata massiliana TaxID=1210884 RepID=A0A6P2D8U9_9BACT|nr:pitrilysin family protein [Gemmata massiliana]VTR95920.1 peptidase m16 : Putative Zn-dependent peptidase OS=Singulisphaera acidiphila (strain ATCC BAA-1392 / DSM 18658 / VKM B-2454 / MOB10) GN=Sinac_0823 PE=3 SV=1: Peptidase_M16: Peptidase_M16_C [Gemmata massiliana]
MGQQVHQHTLPNGLVLLAERMDHVRSVAVNFLIPAGSAFDPDGQFGIATVLAEMLTRGAGDRDSRELSLALDNLGVDRSESAGIVNMRLGGSALARNLLPLLDIYADIILKPRLPEEELEPVQALSIQDIESLEDSPQGKVMVELHRRYYPAPLNKDRRGRSEDIEGLTIDAVRAHYQKFVRPNKAIIAVAGNIEWGALKARIEKLFGAWEPGNVPDVVPQSHQPKSEHLFKDSAQTQIAFAYPSVPIGHADYFAARAAEGVLSGGMSARLFTEVREKRGLCYSVGVRHESFRDRGSMIGYAGTGPDRAQETLDVTLSELRKLKAGVTVDEIDRVKAGLKSSLIMAEESTGARASSIAGDWYFLGRVRSFDEIQGAIDALTPAAVMAHLERHPVRDVALVTLGKNPLTISA